MPSLVSACQLMRQNCLVDRFCCCVQVRMAAQQAEHPYDLLNAEEVTALMVSQDGVAEAVGASLENTVLTLLGFVMTGQGVTAVNTKQSQATPSGLPLC